MTRRMKDSGIEWIGEIPEDWEVGRLKRSIAEIKGGIWGNEAQGNENDIPCMRIADFNRKNFDFIDKELTIRNLEKNKQKEFTLEYGDLLIEKSGGGEKQPVGFVVKYNFDEPAIYTNFMSRLKVNNNIANSNFIKYTFATLYFQGINIRSIKQTTGIQNLDVNSYLNEIIVYPPKPQQKAIADFLDKKVSQIDKIISKTKEAIEEYNNYKQSLITETVTKGLNNNVPMKDSGIEWIGEIPKHWKVVRLKYLLKNPLKYGANSSGCEFDKELPRYIRITDISKNNELKNIDKLSIKLSNDSDFILEDGDILFARSGGTVGKTFLYRDYMGLSAFAGYLIRARINSNNYSKFIYYITLSSYYSKWKDYILIQATIENIGADKYNNFIFPTPPLQEQNSIANYLDKKCNQINNIISTKEKLLRELENYKKSLIYETVTGKREVE